MRVAFRWGSQLELHAEGGTFRDPGGAVVARWGGERLWLRGAPGRELTVEPLDPAAARHSARNDHPVFGRCALISSGGQPCSLMGAVRWSSPQSIPPVAEPARLPPLTGTMLLDVLACCAAAAGIGEMRYVGPYPTAALFGSLSQCFTPRAGEQDFTAAGPALLLAPRMTEAPVAFAPAPFERWWPSPRIGVQARARIERIFVDGAGFDRSATAVRRLIERERGEVAGGSDGGPASAGSSAPAGASDGSAVSHLAAELWFGDTRWATLAELSTDGAILRGPLPLPPIDDPIVGQELPLSLRRALATLIAEAVPPPLAPLVAPILERATLRWGDAGTAAVHPTSGGALLHAALWLTLRPHGPARLALAIAEALTPWVTAEAVHAAATGT